MKAMLRLGLIGSGILLLNCILSPSFGFVENPAAVTSKEASKEASSGNYVNAIEAMSRGNFEEARAALGDTRSDSAGALIKPFSELLSHYDKLAAKLSEARKEAYGKYVREIKDNYNEACWRQGMLQASLKFDCELEKKKKLEKEMEDTRKENLFKSLSQLANAYSLAEKINIPFEFDKTLQEKIVADCLQIAGQLEKADKGLDAYTKVYGYLEVLDKDKYQYEELRDRLQRQVTLEATYLPDPNTEGVTWEDRRKNIDIEMIYRSLATLEYGFVEKPDFKTMCLEGLDYCQILVETGKLSKTFNQLNDADKVKGYRETLEKLMENVKEIESAKFDSRQVLAVIERLLLINGLTVNLPREVLLAEFTEGAYSKTDSYTYVIWPYDVQEFRKSMTNEFSGVGVVIVKDEDGVLKSDSLISYDTPAFRAGIDAGDRILTVDGKATREITIEKAIKLITGPDGTDVTLSIERKGWAEPRDIIVKRKNVQVPTVRGVYRDLSGNWQYFIDQNAGLAYVQLTHFAGETTRELRDALSLLRLKGMRAVILDVRNNSGGYLSGAVDVVDTFVAGGRIVSSRGRGIAEEEVKYAVADKTYNEEIPMVVLVNSLSASASEIVSGALKDNHRALLVGTRTYGKGSVQTIQPLGATEAEMKMTIAKYYLPSGRCVHRDEKDKNNKDYGVEPDITVELTAQQFETYYKTQREAGTLHRDDMPMDQRTWKIYSPQEIIDSDPQMEMAALILKARLLKNDPVVVAN